MQPPANPLVSIVIPVGPAHREVSRQAVASCIWQEYQGWRAIVVNDSGSPLPKYLDSRVSIVEGNPSIGLNKPAVARNWGLTHVTTPFVVFLDADDYLLPEALTTLLIAHQHHEMCYTFSQWYSTNGSHYIRNRAAKGYVQSFYAHFNLHPITALLPTELVRDVGGFDETVRGFEDWTLYLRMARAGYCGHGIIQPTFVYRVYLGVQHHDDAANARQIMDEIIEKYKFGKQEITFMGCGCGGARSARPAILSGTALSLARQTGGTTMSRDEPILLEYIGKQQGKINVVTKGGRRYQVSSLPSRRYLSTLNNTLHPDDVDELISRGTFRVVPKEPEYQNAPDPAPVAEGQSKIIEPDNLPDEPDAGLIRTDFDSSFKYSKSGQPKPTPKKKKADDSE